MGQEKTFQSRAQWVSMVTCWACPSPTKTAPESATTARTTTAAVRKEHSACQCPTEEHASSPATTRSDEHLGRSGQSYRRQKKSIAAKIKSAANNKRFFFMKLQPRAFI